MSGPAHFKLRLHVAGNAPNSARAIANLHALCQKHLPERHEIEIVDVLREPGRALADHVLMTPLLVKLSPAPVCKIVGNLSETPPVLEALGLPSLTR
ncbi:circadian clock KaiB family protein [Luteolibacter arcticus]|uniref:Circadian clock KaiB family protein n=1 Tax=Luteolibacter arcticus TaxID=1581411 RepID=A0ABT3GDL0_9BACT|nr:circadian clock KaiB family protein [Luteolibacter arcticus]MCW1921717.1 circadian clock KaiB family protein [Luteolibacter arcticus]